MCPNKPKELKGNSTFPSCVKEILNVPPTCLCVSGFTSMHHWEHHLQSCSAYGKESWRQQGPFAGVTIIWNSSPTVTPGDGSAVDRFTLVSTITGAKKSYLLYKLKRVKCLSCSIIQWKKKNHDPITTSWEIPDDNGTSQLSVSARTGHEGQWPPHIQITFVNP